MLIYLKKFKFPGTLGINLHLIIALEPMSSFTFLSSEVILINIEDFVSLTRNLSI